MRRAVGRRVLFVGHTAERTGAPIMLLHLLRWLRQHTAIDFDLLLGRDGPLADEYRRVCPVFAAPHVGCVGMVERLRTLGRRPAGNPAMLADLAGRDFGLIYSNTVINGQALAWLAPLSLPVVCHAHEVRTHFRALRARHPRWLTMDADAYISVTRESVEGLTQGGVAEERITLVPGFLPAADRRPFDPAQRRAFRHTHGIPDEAIVVGGCGSIQRQKGPDLFVRIARTLARRPSARRVHLVWLGGRQGDAGMLRLRWDIFRANLSTRMTVIPNVADTEAFFGSLDVFALTSRNDPLPLVVMEAGLHGLPVVCFAGNAEPVDDDCGRVVPGLDVGRFAEAVLELAESGPLRARLGERLAARIRANHDVDRVAPRIVRIIQSFVGPRQSGP